MYFKEFLIMVLKLLLKYLLINIYYIEFFDSIDYVCLCGIVRLLFFFGWGFSWYYKFVNFVGFDNRIYVRILIERMFVKI